MKIPLPNFSEIRVLVAGDVMLDRYWHGDAARISPEAPVPVVRVETVEDRPGGAANVARNLAALGAKVMLLGVVGRDEAASRLQRLLEDSDIAHRLVTRAEGPTITKLRVLSRHQQLIRLDFEEALPAGDSVSLAASFRELLPDCDVVVLSDYAKGTLHECEELIRLAREAGKPVLVDPKGAAFDRYRGATLLTPNRREFEAVAGPCPDEASLFRRGLELVERLELEGLLITRSEEGMTLLRPGHPPFHQEARAREVFDVTGAGDTVISTLALGVGAGLDPLQAVALANLAAGIVVGKLGTATVSSAELRHALLAPGDEERGILSRERLLEVVAAARARGERIVFTNGCFDILHEGHVAYLEEAARLGDRLIVAVNDDASVRRLKGNDRPINPLSSRMAVLAGLAAVDWVVPFSEDTPEALICSVRPDLLVKGGDYRPDEVAGHECVRANGGEVRILDFLEGRSTTGLIRRIRGDG